MSVSYTHLSTTFTSGETITKTDGTGNNWYLWIIAKNTAGTTIITKSNAFYLDNTAPNTTAPTATGTTNTVVVTFAQTDAHSGIDESTRPVSYTHLDVYKRQIMD